jgi:hypothetical protein
MNRRALPAAVAVMVSAACTVGPRYSRPAVAVPRTFSEAAAAEAAHPGTQGLTVSHVRKDVLRTDGSA